MAMNYKLEFVFDDSAPSDSSVYIHLRNNPPIYKAKINKEDYDVLSSGEKNSFLTGLFLIAGVVELSTTAYRVWLMKSPAYNWQEVLDPVIEALRLSFGESSSFMMPGSALHDGSGFTLNSPYNRRST